MANSGIAWIDYAFDWCVILLINVANVIGITYEEINVWLFCIILPIVLIILFFEVIRLRLIIYGIRKNMSCVQCSKKKLSIKIWQTSLDRYVEFCSEECMKLYLMRKYKKNQQSRAVGLALELAERY